MAKFKASIIDSFRWSFKKEPCFMWGVLLTLNFGRHK